MLKRFGSVDLWEINPAYEAALREAMPTARVTIGDSHELATRPENQHRFDAILMDNHVGVFGGHVEHFDALELVPRLLDRGGGVLVVNLCTQPEVLLMGNYLLDWRVAGENTRTLLHKMKDGTYFRWLEGRTRFYGCEAITVDYAKSVYAEYFAKLGFIVGGFKAERRRTPCLYLLRMRLTRHE
jgi:hypothetical protein